MKGQQFADGAGLAEWKEKVLGVVAHVHPDPGRFFDDCVYDVLAIVVPRKVGIDPNHAVGKVVRDFMLRHDESDDRLEPKLQIVPQSRIDLYPILDKDQRDRTLGEHAGVFGKQFVDACIAHENDLCGFSARSMKNPCIARQG